MTQRDYKIDLQETQFPMLSEQQTRTTILPSAGEDPGTLDKPSVAYCHNVMPTRYGFNSIGYQEQIAAAADLVDSFIDVRVAYGDAQTRIYLAWDASGRVYVMIPRVLGTPPVWTLLPQTVPALTAANMEDKNFITVATVNGVSYIWYKFLGCFQYNETTTKLDNITLTGIAIGATKGVVASSGYLLVYTALAVAWSSTVLPTDFTPSAITGAGGANVAGIAGNIIFATSNTLGIIFYATANAIAATYTGNIQFPFKFREIDDSKGGINLDLVAYEANSTEQFIFSKAGIQVITSQRAKGILPEVTDFLSGRRFEDYNETTELAEVSDVFAFNKKIKYIASRYLVISYGNASVVGANTFTHALVYDTSLNKLGKLKVTHVDCFEYIGLQFEIAKESLAFVDSTGIVKTVDFTVASTTSSGVLILGKMQLTRRRLLVLLGVELENIEPGSTLRVLSQASLDGKTFTNVEGTLKKSAGNLRTYNFRSTAKNHSLVLLGKFNEVTAQILYALGGKR